MGNEVFVRLSRFLDRLPTGYPQAPDGADLEVLKHFFSEEEAEMTMQLRYFPEPPSIIARRVGRPEAQVAEMLEAMSRKGLIFGLKSGGRDYYQAIQYVVGIHEWHVDTIDAEYVELNRPYFKRFVGSMTPAKQFRVVPVNSAIDAMSTIAPHEKVKELVRNQDRACVADCICKKGKAAQGKPCGKPQETCLIFSYGVDYYVRYGKAREISIDEAIRIVDRAEEAGLVLMGTNSKDIINFCCCCGCCCDVLSLIKMTPRPVEHVHSEFQARLEPENCTQCETCLERCQMEALYEFDGAIRVDEDRCIGCGLCVSTCEGGALSLAALAEPGDIPANHFHMLAEIARERGVGFGALSPLMKHLDIDMFLKNVHLLYRSGLGKPLVNFMARRGWV